MNENEKQTAAANDAKGDLGYLAPHVGARCGVDMPEVLVLGSPFSRARAADPPLVLKVVRAFPRRHPHSFVVNNLIDSKLPDVIAEIETDKATMEVESVDDGVMAKIFVDAGTENVAVGAVIAVLAEDDETASDVAKTSMQRRACMFCHVGKEFDLEALVQTTSKASHHPAYAIA